MFIPKNIEKIIKILQSNKFKAYVIGGCVRDSILRNKCEDYDICTSATPDEIKKIFPKANIVGNNFLVSIINGIEVATFRKDHAELAEPVKSLRQDILRRDFTINSLAYDLSSRKIIDYVDGIKDINNRILRFVGNADERIIQDPIRILRGLRFASKFNLQIDNNTYFSIFRNRCLLLEIPRERIQKEIIKAFSHNNTHRFLTLLNELEILNIVFPHSDNLQNIDGGGYHNEKVLSHCFNAVKSIENKHWMLKLSAFMHDYGKCKPEINDKGFNTFKGHDMLGVDLAKRDLKYLKFPNSVINYVITMVELHMHELRYPKSIKKLVRKLHQFNIPIKHFFWLRWADSNGNMLKKQCFKEHALLYKKALKELNKKQPFNVKDLDITGNDIMDLFNIPQCKEIGKMLNFAFEGVTNDVINNNKEEIINYLRDSF